MAEKYVFFVCGAPKSGTTWLQRVLDAHPAIQCSGEGHFIERFTVPLAQVMRDYVTHMNLVADRVYEGDACYPPIRQDDLDRLARIFILDRLAARNAAPEVRWIGDKTPRYTNCLDMLLRLFPETRFVNIVRDPRDVALSRLHQARRAGLHEMTVKGTAERATFLHDGGLDWMRNVEPADAFARAHPGRVHTLYYENMIADPLREAQHVFAFLGAPAKSDLVADIVKRTSFEALSGRKAGNEHPTSFFRKGVAGDWRRGLEEAGQDIIEDMCGPLMRLHGYEMRASAPTSRVSARA